MSSRLRMSGASTESTRTLLERPVYVVVKTSAECPH
jgi:hypothetical protein